MPLDDLIEVPLDGQWIHGIHSHDLDGARRSADFFGRAVKRFTPTS